MTNENYTLIDRDDMFWTFDGANWYVGDKGDPDPEPVTDPAIIGTDGEASFEEARDAIIQKWDARPEVPAHPLIDFSGDSRATARIYARDSNSRSLDPAHRKVLAEVAAGAQDVDAYDVVEAAQAALSLATTRAGQSMMRRDYARKARHLLHIANAVVRNHADGLPTYEPGERSPKLREAQSEIERLLDENLGQQQEIERLRARAEEHEERGDTYAEQVDDLNALVEALNPRLTATSKEAEAARRTLAYAQNLLRQAEAGNYADRLEGYYQALLDNLA